MNIDDTLNERAKTHGSYVEQSKVSQYFKQTLRACPQWGGLTLLQKESIEMIAAKLSRIVHGDPQEVDHWRDIAGYAQLAVKDMERDR